MFKKKRVGDVIRSYQKLSEVITSKISLLLNLAKSIFTRQLKSIASITQNSTPRNTYPLSIQNKSIIYQICFLIHGIVNRKIHYYYFIIQIILAD